MRVLEWLLLVLEKIPAEWCLGFGLVLWQSPYCSYSFVANLAWPFADFHNRDDLDYCHCLLLDVTHRPSL